MTTLAELRDLVLQRVDMVNTNFISDAELNSWINQGADTVYDLIVQTYEDYYTNSFQFTIASNEDGYTLPDSVYKIRGLDFQVSGDWLTVHRFTMAERNRANRQINRGLLGFTNIKYKWIGNTIKIIPAEQAAGTYQCWYIPNITPLTNDSDELPVDIDRWKELVIAEAGVKCLIKEESDPSGLEKELMEMKGRVLRMAANRDAGSPERVQDVRYDYDPWGRF